MPDPEACPIITALIAFPEAIKRAIEDYDPTQISQIAKYIIKLSRAFNKYYASVRILCDSELKQQRLSGETYP
ncbi:DALR anticodon-binding domain-containing protein [Bacillus sp. FJAT-18017]|uniref:DALR anticodon-binding domain-containing protein n=1 Tax=Bacillus sp. FJAT-18017 TaxID=1705566 RepID=UPI001E47208D|nr:DALR anticodon-binding domain-containing protein [Bacillus sp. FJAT-18017]